jgi:hypothetical protein
VEIHAQNKSGITPIKNAAAVPDESPQRRKTMQEKPYPTTRQKAIDDLPGQAIRALSFLRRHRWRAYGAWWAEALEALADAGIVKVYPVGERLVVQRKGACR